jgi:DNA-directed RNA polymerase subunit L/Txe/YoeB family toxin of Txe-Axe toxin-antitoxin module
MQENCKERFGLKKHITAIIDIVSSIKSKEEYDTNNILVDKILYKTNNYEEYCNISFTQEYIKQLKNETKALIKDACKHVYNGDIETYADYNRCTPCLQKIAYILNINQSVLYTTETLPAYKFTISTNSIECKTLWNNSRKLLKNKCSKLLKNIEKIVETGVTKHGVMEHGYYVNFPDTTHTMGNIMVHELLADDSLDISSYIHEHPLHTNIKVVLKFKNAPDDINMAIIELFKVALQKSIVYIKTIPRIV